MGLSIAILSGFGLALVAPALHRIARGATGWLLALAPLGLMAFFLSHAVPIASGSHVEERFSWAPSLGIELSFVLDGLSLLFGLLITGIGALILIYAGGYLAGHPQLGRIYAFLLLFMSSMLGLVLADNLLALFVFWELTSISSYLLIGFNHDRTEARAAALQALLVTGGGGLALMAGVLLLGQIGGSLDVSVLRGRAGDIVAHPLYVSALLLILLGAFTKSAQFPFHFWLPGAMEAPTPVSAYLHSATMVKAGVYLLARLYPVLGDSDWWRILVTGFGAATMLFAGILALFQKDLKRILAYSTVSALGTMVLLLGVGTSGAVQACLVFLLAHALYKGALFMIAGILDHETGTRDVDRLGGLWRAMPITMAAALLAAMSLAGFGPVLSFIGKEMVFEAILHAEAWLILAPAAVFAGGLFVTVAGLAGLRPFFGRRKSTPHTPHEAGIALWLGPALLAVGGVVIGLMPQPLGESLVTPAVLASYGPSDPVHLALWHGFNTALAMSAVSLVLGITLYLSWDWLHRHRARFEPMLNAGPERGYELGLQGLNFIAAGQTRILQSGYLRYYLLIVLTATVLLAGGILIWDGITLEQIDWSGLHFYEVGLVVLILLAILATLLARSRLAAIAALGVVGYSVALIFVLFGAPDVAMTQFLVETLTVILFVLVFYHLREAPVLTSPLSRGRDVALALLVGSVMTVLVLIAANVQYHPSISGYYGERSVPDAYGRNLVNVILVDFRGLDTLGEITVLAAAGIGVFALLKLRPQTNGSPAISDGAADAPMENEQSDRAEESPNDASRSASSRDREEGSGP